LETACPQTQPSLQAPRDRGASSLFSIFACLAAFCAARQARADFFLHFWENHYRDDGEALLAPELSFLGTSANFDTNGVAGAVSGLTSYSRMQTDVLAAASIRPRLSAYGRLSWANISVERGTTGGRSFGLTDQSLGTTFRLLGPVGTSDQGFSVDAQLQGDLPAYNNRTARAEGLPFRGDGSMDLTGGFFLRYRFGKGTGPSEKLAPGFWDLTAGAGYTYRTDQFSAALPWSLSLRYHRVETGWSFGFAVLGVQSLQTDSSSGVDRSAQDAGGSFLVNAINPSHSTARAELGYRFSPRVLASLKGFQTLAGVSAPQLQSALLAFEIRLAEPRAIRRAKNPLQLTGPEYGRSNQGVVDYVMDAKVTRVNDRLNLVRIDKGTADGVQEGQVFDIFAIDENGVIREAVARAKCQSVGSSEAVLNVVEYFREVWIEAGFVAKRPIQ
jgi:hypothetical protein